MKKLLGLIIFCIPLYVFGSDDSSTDSEFDENPVISKVIQNEKYEKNKPTRLFIEGSRGVGILMFGFGLGWSGNLGIELRRFQLYVGGGCGETILIGESMKGTYLSSGIRYIFQDVGAKGVFGIQAHYYIKQEGSISTKFGKMTPLPVSVIVGNYWDIGEHFRIGGCGVFGGPEFLTIRALISILIPL